MFDLDLRVRTEVLIARRSLSFVAKAHASAENIMKLVRFDGGKTGLMVEFPSGPHVINVIGSLGDARAGRSHIAGHPQRYPERQGKLGSVHRALGAGANWIATTGGVSRRET
jgi:hypothetical protein